MKTLIILAVVCIGLASCQQKPSAVSDADQEKASKAVAELFDGFNSSFKSKDATTMGNYMSEDGLFLGTEPGEFWTKEQVLEELNKLAADTAVDLNYTTDKREVRIARDGNSAMVVEQSFVSFLGEIPVRMIGHAALKDGEWKVDFYSWSLMAKSPRLADSAEGNQ